MSDIRSKIKNFCQKTDVFFPFMVAHNPLPFFFNALVKLSFQKFRIYRTFHNSKLKKSVHCLFGGGIKSLLEGWEGRSNINTAAFHIWGSFPATGDSSRQAIHFEIPQFLQSHSLLNIVFLRLLQKDQQMPWAIWVDTQQFSGKHVSSKHLKIQPCFYKTNLLTT